MIVQEISRSLHTLLTSNQLLSTLVLCGTHISNVYNQEQVQRRGARFVTGRYQRHESVTEMITELKWNTLQQRRFTAKQTMMWKSVNNQIAVHIPDHIHRPTEQSRGHHSHTYINVRSKTDGYKFSFYPRTIRCWNLLPESGVMA